MTTTIAAPASLDPALAAVREKLDAGRRLSIDDGLALYRSRDLWGVCELAHTLRQRLTGDIAYYNVNRHLNYSNVCALSCKFCDFFAKQGDEKAYTHTLEDIRRETRLAVKAGATEIHVVGGLHPQLPWEYYPDLVRTIRQTAGELGSDLHVKAFTAVEIVHIARIAKVYKAADRTAGIRWVLDRLKEAGLGSLPGGGAEVFDDRVHDETFKGKIRSDVWLDVHRVAHELGLNTNATILYGHVEDRRERLVHMDLLRRAQDEALVRLGYEPGDDGAVSFAPVVQPSGQLRYPHKPPTPGMNDRGGYFQAIIPLPFFPDGSELEHLPGPGGLENLRTTAIARLMLDNFPHVKAFWIMQTLPMAQLMLRCGADDIDGTVVWYDVTKVGGTGTHQEVGVAELEMAIREAGFTPVERDTLYRRVACHGGTWRLADSPES